MLLAFRLNYVNNLLIVEACPNNLQSYTEATVVFLCVNIAKTLRKGLQGVNVKTRY